MIQYELWSDPNGASVWLLKRCWQRLGWHTVEWCGAYKDSWHRGNDGTYPLVSKQSTMCLIEQSDFNEAMTGLGARAND